MTRLAERVQLIARAAMIDKRRFGPVGLPVYQATAWRGRDNFRRDNAESKLDRELTVTISASERADNLNRALVLMLDATDSNPIDDVYFRPDDAEFASILATTWSELLGRGYIKNAVPSGPPHYQLTGGGWAKAMQVSERAETVEFQERLGKLTAALKQRIKGRSDEALVSLHELAGETQLPLGWVTNAIEADAISVFFRRRGATWRTARQVVSVPLDFGLPL